MCNNKFFVIEGIDGTGKSTVLPLLAEKLGAVAIEMPNGIWRKYRHVVENAHPTIRFFYYVLSNQFASLSIRKMLRKSHVVCARFAYSTKAHHIIYGCRISKFFPLWLVANKQPTLVYYLTVSQQERERRLFNRKKNNAKDLDSEALEKVNKAFQSLPGMINVDTTNLNAEEVSNTIFLDITSRLGIGRVAKND